METKGPCFFLFGTVLCPLSVILDEKWFSIMLDPVQTCHSGMFCSWSKLKYALETKHDILSWILNKTCLNDMFEHVGTGSHIMQTHFHLGFHPMGKEQVTHHTKPRILGSQCHWQALVPCITCSTIPVSATCTVHCLEYVS